MAELEVGAKVPVELQLGDGAVDQYPQAWVFDDVGGALATLNLTPTANGWYSPAAPYTMPDEVFVSVVYVVYSDAGHSVESTVYERTGETFIRVDPDDYKANVSALEFIQNIEGGRWHIIGNQMIFYEADNVTEIARFNLLDAGGNPTMINVMERVRV